MSRLPKIRSYSRGANALTEPVGWRLAVTNPVQSDPVPAIRENDAVGSTAEIFTDIRETLNVDVVNLIWRHLATMPGALEWVWESLRPLYLGAALSRAKSVRDSLALPSIPAFSGDVLSVAGIDDAALASIRRILDSYQHTNALALVCFSAFLMRFGGSIPQQVSSAGGHLRNEGSAPIVERAPLPGLIPVAEMPPALARLVHELNEFGEDSDLDLVASMYRHLAHWPVYLALVRTLLVPFHRSGELKSVVARVRILGEELGEQTASCISTTPPHQEVDHILSAIRRFVRHPIARMTSICSLIRTATPELISWPD
jgi:hypothetical protein